MTIECSTQKELDAALRDHANDDVIACVGGTWSNRLIVNAPTKWHVVARENSNVVAWENSNVVARENSNVVAWGNSNVVAWGNSNVVATPYVSVHHLSDQARVEGGVIIKPPKLDTGKKWVEFYGLPVERGIVTLYKAVDDEYLSNYKQSYAPGTKPICADWKPTPDCGNGFHLCADPRISKMRYAQSATKFVGVPVRVSQIVPILDYDGSSDKVKVPKVAGAIFEVDAKGNRVVA